MTKKEEKWYQYVVEKEEREIEYVDFTGKTMEEAEAEMTAWTRVPFQQEDAPMNKIKIIKLPDGYQGYFSWETTVWWTPSPSLHF